MKWLQVAVWLQKGLMVRENDNPVGEKLQGLERNSAGNESKQGKPYTPSNEIGENDVLSWMNDRNLYLFFRNEINIKKTNSQDALSAANEKGLY